MPKQIKNLTNMEIDEISTVDKGANQHAMFVIAKRAPEEDVMPEFDIYNTDGELLSEDSLNDGDVVYDAEGNAYQFELDAAEEVVEDKELAEVGKSAFFDATTKTEPVNTDFAKSVMEELSKAFDDDERDKVIAKALGKVAEQETRLEALAKTAKSERDLRLTREYISKAHDYNVPVDPNELGPVLYRMAETMSYEDCSVIAKCLETAGEMLFAERGFQGGGDNGDIMSQVEAQAVEIGKAATPETVTAVFDQAPEAYNEYLASRRGI